MYIVWQSICTLYLLTCQVRVTIGDSGLCSVQALINCPFPQLMLYPALSSVSILRLKCTSWLRSRLVSPSRPASERDIRRHYDIIVCRNKINMRIPVKNSACVCVWKVCKVSICAGKQSDELYSYILDIIFGVWLYRLSSCSHDCPWSTLGRPQSGVPVIRCLFCPYREEPELEPVEPELEDKVSEGEAPEEAELKAAEAAAEAAESSRKEEEVRDWNELPAGIVVSLPWHCYFKSVIQS